MTSTQRGFNLLEVLVALAVLAIGLLGLAALQNVGLRYNNESYQRTQATMLVYEMIDRMRANPDGVRAGNYNGFSSWMSAPPGSNDCSATACANTADMAAYDVNQWITAITQRAVLNSGAGSITAVGGSLFDVGVQWREQDVTLTQLVRVQLP